MNGAIGVVGVEDDCLRRLRGRIKLRELALERNEFAAERIGFGLDLCEVRGLGGAFAVLHAGEDGFDREIIRLRDRVELVIMAAGAANGEAEERAAGGTHHVVQFVGALVRGEHGVGTFHAIPGTGHQKTRCCVGSELISSELFEDEAVVRLILVESADHIVAIMPRVRSGLVRFEAVALGEAHHIEPMPRPALAVSRACEQFVHELCVGLRIFVGHERCDLFWRWRQTDEIEVKPADERAPVGFR